MQVGFDELHPIEPEPPRRCCGDAQRFAGEIGPDDDSARAGEIKAHLPRPAPNLDDARVEADRAIQQARKLAATGSRAQPCVRVMWRVSWKRRLLVETPHAVDARLARKSKIGDAVQRRVARPATVTRPARRQSGPAPRARHQVAELLFHQ